VLFVCLLFGLPSGLVFAPLGAAGAPSSLLGMGFLGWWISARLVPGLGVPRGRQPIRIGLYAFALSVGASYLTGALRPMTGEEASSSARGLLTVCAWAGIVLVTMDGLSTRAALDRLLQAVVRAGIFLAVLGLIQFFSGWNPATLIQIPGLHFNSSFGSTIARDSFTRVQGTATHAIEFGVVLAMVLPLALHYAWFAPEHRRRRWVGVLLIGFALPLTVSRSAIAGLLIVIVVMFISWPPHRRRQVLLVLPFVAVALKLLIPGLLGTIRGLFLNFSADPSTQGRTDDYAALSYYVGHSPFFGRGISTFIPELYRTLDNAYLGWVLEAGVVGLAVLIGWMLTAIGLALRIRLRSSTDERSRDLAAALMAGLLSAAFNFGTFDALGFAICAGLFFLLVGATGALWRLTGNIEPDPAAGLRPLRLRDLRRLPRALARVVPLAGAAIGMALILVPGVVRTSYVASGSILLLGPQQHGEINPYAWSPYLELPSEITQRLVMSPDTAAALREQGFGDDYTVAAGIGSLMPWTDRVGRGPLVRIQSRADSSAQAVADRDAVIREAKTRFEASQLDVGSPVTELIRMAVVTAPTQAAAETGNRKHALVTAAGLGYGIAAGLQYLIRRPFLRGRRTRV
jgi:hypothetical protein